MTVAGFEKTVSMSRKPLVLATDLDGTFLGGEEADRRALYRWIEENRDLVGLIFVTGRDPDFVQELTRTQGVPRPDYFIGDVGTTIAQVDDSHALTPIPHLEAEIQTAWGDASQRVRDALEAVSGLQVQPTAFRYRVSYDMDPARFDARAKSMIEAMGLDWLMSDNRFFDVLPKGVSKGPSLLRLLAHLGIAHRKCLVAGDTLNDLSMLSLGIPAVAVGNAEAALLAQVSMLDHVHVAEGAGALGIAEAIRAFEFLDTTATQEA